FFRVVRTRGDTNEVERSNILAPGLTKPLLRHHLLPAFTDRYRDRLAVGSRIQLQQRNCSRFTRDFSRRSTFLVQTRKELRSTTTDLHFVAQDKFQEPRYNGRRARIYSQPSRHWRGRFHRLESYAHLAGKGSEC